MARETEIKFNIQLDDQNLPTNIKWSATDGNQVDEQECKSMMISLWDAKEKNTLRIDLWTKDFTVDQMHMHFFQSLITMTESYQRATNNPFVMEAMKQFCNDLAAKTRTHEMNKQNQ
ncbi:MAG: gliding motility protein GldC [Chitinophagales bacterium]|nr:gliding motility protein GldC [Chitinophagales bacterium]